MWHYIALIWCALAFTILQHQIGKVQSSSICDSSITFTGTKVLNANDGYKVSWYVDTANQQLYLKLEMNAANSKGFMGFGLGEQTSGSMLGADIATVRISSGIVIVEDRHVPFDSYPIDNYSTDFPAIDNCQDWTVVTSEVLSSSWSATIKRNLTTADAQDRDVITNAPQRIIFAWSKTYTSVQYHGSNRGASSIDFASATGDYEVDIPDAVDTLELLMDNYTLPTKYDTYYVCKGFDVTQLIDLDGGDRHVLKVDPIIEVGNENYVHHMLVHACGTTADYPYSFHPHGSAADICMKDGANGNSPLAVPSCVTLMYGWAVGSNSIIMPKDVGIRIGNTTTSNTFTTRFIIVEIHYDNKAKLSGIKDSSGVKLHITAKGNERAYDAAVLTLGVADQPPKLVKLTDNQHLEGECSSSCTSKFSGALNVFGSFLHVHSYGKQVWTAHYAGGDLNSKTITNRIDYWNFKYQQFTNVSFTINPGDSLHTHAVYDLSDSTSDVKFGEKSSEEMLFDFVFVYPATNLNGIFNCGSYGASGVYVFPLCGIDVDTNSLPASDGDTSLPYEFGVETAVCEISTLVQSKSVCAPTQSPVTSKPSTSVPTKAPADKVFTNSPTKLPTTISSNSTNSPTTQAPVTKSPSKDNVGNSALIYAGYTKYLIASIVLMICMLI